MAAEFGQRPQIPKTMNAPSYFEIQADDLKRAREFYGGIFGWRFVRAEGLPVEY